MSRILLRWRARRDLAEAITWYRERDPGVAEQFATAVEETLDHIERFPTGTLVPGIEDQRVRRFPLFNFPYHVIFVVLRRGVSVVAIAHDRRRPGYWR